MSADSPRRGPSSRCGGLSVPAIVPPQVVSDRSILDSAIGFINDVTLAHQPHTDPKDTITWARFESMADISDPRFGEDWELEGNVAPPLLLILGYGMGVQVWAIPANGEAIEVLSWRHGTVSALRVLPTPTIAAEDAGRRADELIDAFAEKRPLMAMCDGGSSKASGGPQPQYCAVNFVSLKTGTQVKTIKFKNAVLDILANRTSIAITFHERIAVFDARTLEDRLSITTCYPSPGINPNPVAMGSRWLAYAEHKLLHSKRSGGGCDGEGVASYTATMLNAAKSFGKGLRELGEQVAAGLTGTSTAGGSGSNSKNSSFDSNSSGDMRQAGIVTVMDIKFPIKEISPTSGTPISINGSDPFVAHFIAHSEAVVAMEFDNSGMLLVTADKRGHDFHVFRIQPHPVGSSLAAVHHLYVLHRGDTSAKVQNIACSLDSRWIAVSTLRGTTHVFPITPYGGAMGVRTHTSLHVVNKLSRFHRSAGLSAEGRSSSPISHSESTTFSQSLIPYHNPTLPPYTRPTVVLPLAQLRQPFVLGSPPGSAVPLSKSSGSAVVGSGNSQRQRLSSLSDDNGKPLSVCAIFAKSRSWLLDPPNATREAPHRIQRKAVDSLFVMAGHGALIQYDLDTKLASNIAKEKICDETPIELEVEAKAQWNLGRKDGSQEIMPPLSTDNWLIKDRNSCMLTDSTRQFDDSDDRADSWLSQVEIITHAGPHRRLWMGPQFVFKTYNTPSGSNLSHIEAEAVEIGVSATSAAAAAAARAERSSPLNMPLSATARASVPVLIESGSYSSIEQSPKLMDRFRHEHLDSDFSVSHGDSRLKEDLADAMRESPSVSKDVTGRLLSDAAYDCAPYYDALAEHVVDDDSSYDSTHRSAAAALAHALPNIYSYAAYSSHEAPAQPRSIEKVVNPLGTVTTITAGMSSEVSTDILDEVVSQLAAEDCVIHENCDESLFRPVVAIFCDEKSRMEGEEARRQQELCKPPEVIGTKLIVPVIDKERDDELCKKEKLKTLRSGMESVASKISRPVNRAVREEEQPLSKDDQQKFAELAHLSKKRPAETAEKETVTLSKEESRMDKKKDSGAIPKEPKVVTAKEVDQTERREEREKGSKAQWEEKFQDRDDVEQKEVGSRKMSETVKQLEANRKNERRSSTQTDQQNRVNEKNCKETNLEDDRQKEDKPVVIKKKMQKKGNGKEREQRSSEEREERKLDEAVSKEKYSVISNKEPIQTSTVELKTASVELKTSTESKVKEKAKKGQRKSEERDEIHLTTVSIKNKTQADRAEQEESQNEEETLKENKRTAQKESVEKKTSVKEPKRAEQKEDKNMSEEEKIVYIKDITQKEETQKAPKEKEDKFEENKQEKDKSAQKEPKLKKINRSQEEEIDEKRDEKRNEKRAERKDEERREKRDEKRNETIDAKKDEKKAGKRDENKDEKRDDENKAGKRDENKDEKSDDKKKVIKIDGKHDDKINEKKDDSCAEKKNAKKAEKKNDGINENVGEKKSGKKDAMKEEHICEKKNEKKYEKYEEKNQEKNEEKKDEKIYEKKAEEKEEISDRADKKLVDKSKTKCLSIDIEEDDVENDKPIEFKRMTPLGTEKPTKQTAEYAKQSANKKTADNENLSSKVKTKTNEKLNQKQMAMVESTTKTSVDETDSKIKSDKSSKSKASTTTDAIKTEQLNVADLEDSLIEIDTSHESKEVTKSKNEVEKKSMAAKVVELNEPVDIYGDAAKSTKKKKQKTHSSASNSECEEFIDVAPTKSTKAKKSIQHTAEKPARIEQKSSTSSEESFTDLTESFLEKKQNMSQTLFESFSEIMEKEVNTKVRKPRTDVEKVAKQDRESRKLESASITSESTIEDNDFRLAKDAENKKAKTKAKLEESVTYRQLSENEARKVVPTTDEGKVSKEKTKLTSAELRENESKLNTLSSDTKSKLKVKNDEIQEPKVVVKMETALDLPVKSTTVEEKQLKETKGAIKKQIVSKKSSVTLTKSGENQQQSAETGKEKPKECFNDIILPTKIKKSLADILKGEAEIIPTPIPTSTTTSTLSATIPIQTPNPDMKKSKSKAKLDTNKLPETAAAHITLPITEQPKKTKSGAPSLALEDSKSILNKKITSPDVILDVMMTTVDSKSSAKSQNVNRTKNEVASSSEDAEKTLLFFDKFSPEHKKSAATEPIQTSEILKPVSAWQTLSGAEMISKNLAESTAAVEKNYPSLGGRVGKTNNKKTKTTTAAEESKLITMETEIPAPSTKAIKKYRKELNSSNSSFDEFSMLKSFDALPPLPVLEPLEIKTCLKTPDDEVSAAIAASTESQVSLINFESPQLEHRSLAAHTSKITPTPRGFNEQNLIFALCGSLHYENESSSRERSTSDYKSLIEHINDEQYLNLEQSTLETTNKKEKSTSSSSNSSGSEEIMVVAVEQKKLSKKQQRHKQLLEQAELMKQQQKNKKEKQRRAADEDDGQADDADDDDDDDDDEDDDDDNDDDDNDDDDDANDDNDDEELQPLISITETKLDYYINSRESRDLTTHGANVELQNKKKYQKSAAAAAGGGSTTTDSEGPMAATTPSDDNNYQRGAALATTTTGNKLKTKKLEHKINLIAAIEAATSSSTSSAEEESGVEAGGSGGGVSIVGAIEASAVVTMSATAASNAQSAPTSFQQSASKKKTKRRKR